MHDLPRPFLLFLGEATDEAYAKTACGIRDWRREDAIGQFRLPGCSIDLGLPDLGPAEAAAAGARALVIGVAPIGARFRRNGSTSSSRPWPPGSTW